MSLAPVLGSQRSTRQVVCPNLPRIRVRTLEHTRILLVSDRHNRIEVDREGNFVAHDRSVSQRLREYAGHYRVVSDSAGIVVLRRETQDDLDADAEPDEEEEELGLELEAGALGSGGRVILAGELLTMMTLFQMIEVIAERNFRGDLAVMGADGCTMQLAFDQGALKHAKSDRTQDRLGELLVREGYIDSERLQQLLAEVSSQRRLGEVCLDQRVISREELFACLHRQTEEIFFHTLLVSHGSYVFSTPDSKRAPPALSVHLPVRPLLMQGVQRLDEMELFRQVIASDDVCLERLESDAGALDGAERIVLNASDGATSLAEICARSGLGEYAVTKVAYHLVKERRARVHVRALIDSNLVEALVDVFTAIILDIFATIESYGGLDTAKEMLGAWVQGCGYDTVFGTSVTVDGTIDGECVSRWVHSARDDNPVAGFHQVAHELVSFALFCAGSALPRDAELALSRDVNTRLQAIRSP